MQSLSPNPSDSHTHEPSTFSDAPTPKLLWQIWGVIIVLSTVAILITAISAFLQGGNLLLLAAVALLITSLVIGHLFIFRSKAFRIVAPEIIERQVLHLNALNRLSSRLAQSANVEETYVIMQDELSNLVDNYSSLAIYLLSEDLSAIEWVYGYMDGKQLPTHKYPRAKLERRDFIEWVAEIGQPLLVQQNTQADLPTSTQGLTEGSDAKSWLGIPLSFGHYHIGVLTIANQELENAFSREDVHNLSTAVSTLTVTIQNLRLFNSTQSALNKEAEKSIQLQTATEVSSTLGGVLDPNVLMQQTIDLILERFGLYYVGFFLIDDSQQYAVLQAGTGKAGQEQLANRHRHRINSKSLIGKATADGQPRVHQNVKFAENWFANPLLPNTQSEIALPLRARGRILGALTAQSIEVNKFSYDLVQVLQSMCDQIAVALDNANLFSQLQENISQIDSLYQAERHLVESKSQENVYASLVTYAADQGFFDIVRIIAPNEQKNQAYMRQSRYWIRNTFLAEEKRETFATDSYQPFHDLPTTELLRVSNFSVLAPSTESFLEKYKLTNLVLMPIKLGQRWFGSLVVAAKSEIPDDKALQPLITLCDQAAIVLSNQNLINETGTLYTLSRKLSEALTQDDMAQITADKLVSYTGAKQVRILFHDRSLNLTKIATSASKEVAILPHDYIFNDPVYKKFKDADTEFIVVDKGDQEPSNIVGRYLRPYNIQATLFVPAISQHDLIGFIMLDSTEGHWPFTASSMNFTRTAADQFAVTNENFILFNQTLSKAQDLVMLNQIGAKIASTLNMPKLARIVFEESQKLFPFTHFILATYDYETNQFQSILMAQENNFFSPTSGLVPNIIQSQLQKKQAQVFNAGNTTLKQLIALLPTENISANSALFTPLNKEEQPVGFIAYLANESHRFSENHLQLARAIANQTALSMINVGLLQETQNTVAELRTLFNVTQSLASSVESRTRLENTLQTLHYTLRRADIAVVFSDDQNKNPYVMAHYGQHYDLPNEADWPESKLAKAMTRNSPLLLDSSGNSVSRNQRNVRYQEIIVPLSLYQETIGCLHVKHQTAEVFTERDLRLLQTLSVSLAATLENGRLFRQIQDANERLLELDRMKTQFLANMSHELRTPLNSIIGFSRLILKGIDGPINPTQHEDLSSIYSSGQHLLNLINDILDLAKLDAGKMALVFNDVDVMALANSLQVTVRGILKEKDNIQLIWDIEPHLPLIEADEVRLRQILLNLLSNAAKFTAQGHIRLFIGRSDDTPDHILLTVEDTGIGIAEEDFPRLFLKFEQLDDSPTRQVDGTGLGLPIVNELVLLHHGSIWFDSKINRGTTFNILLPIRQKESSPQPETSNASTDSPTIAEATIHNLSQEKIAGPQLTQTSYDESLAILLVDDEPGVLSLYKRYLSGQNNPLITAQNGREALNLLHNKSREIGLVLLDIHMPDVDGWQVLDEMRSTPALAHIPVIICSVDINEQQAQERGAQLALPKPIISDDLSRVIQFMQTSPSTTPSLQ